MRYHIGVFTVAALLFSGLSPARSPETRSKAGDEQMTCEQIATELAPYAQQIRPSVSALNDTNMELKRRGEKHLAEEAPIAAAQTAASLAAAADPTGLSQRAVNRSIEAHQQEARQRYLAEDKPLADRQLAQAKVVAAQGEQLQSNARIQQLMRLAQEQHCH
jgi:electron transfer flavoprotein alpha subunit